MPDLNINQQHERDFTRDLHQAVKSLGGDLLLIEMVLDGEESVSDETLNRIGDSSNEIRRIFEFARLIRRRNWLELTTTRRVMRETQENMEAIRIACQAEEARLAAAREKQRETEALSRAGRLATRMGNPFREEAEIGGK